MNLFHDEDSTAENLKRDAKDPDNPYGNGIPDSIRRSAQQELRRRGFSESEINEIRLSPE